MGNIFNSVGTNIKLSRNRQKHILPIAARISEIGVRTTLHARSKPPHTSHCHPNTTALRHASRDVVSTTTGLEACYRASRLPVDIRIPGSPCHVYKDCVLPLEKTAFYQLFQCVSLISLVVVVSFVFIVSFVVLISVHSHSRSVSFGAPLARPPSPSFLKGSTDLTLDSGFTELVPGVLSGYALNDIILAMRKMSKGMPCTLDIWLLR